MKIFATGLLFLLYLGAYQSALAAPETLLLEIGIRQISLEHFENVVATTYPDLEILPVPDRLRVKARLVQELIDRELIAAEAARRNIDISPDELDAAWADVRGQYSEEEFTQFLHKQNKSRTGWLAALRQRLLTAEVTAALVAQQPAISTAQLEDYYRQHKEDFRRPLEVQARQMLFASREEALKVRQLVRDGGDFATLAQRYSLSPDRENGGNLGYFAQGMLPKEFDDAIFRLPLKKVSDPIKSPYGYHLFLVEQRHKAGMRPYVIVKEEIYQLLRQHQEEEIFHQWLEKSRESTVINVNWQLLEPASKQ